ncbi:MAG: DUF937 domain-containing protein [Myxococcota bacterium]
MSALVDAIQAELSGHSLSGLAGALGIPQEKAPSAVAAALPVLLGALNRTAASPTGAEALAGALERDHTAPLTQQLGGGGLGALVGQVLAQGGPKALDGAGILGHLLGRDQPAAAEAVASKTGLDAATAGKLLIALAPLVMSALGTVKQRQGLDAGGLASFLGQEQQSLGGSLLSGFLDAKGDGIGLDDLVRVGGALQQSGLLGKLFGG